MRFLHLLMVSLLLAACATRPSGPTEDQKLFVTVKANAASGDVAAERELGLMYVNEQGTAYDPAEAAIWFRKAADAGDPEAQVNLGWLYEHGSGVTTDVTQAQELFLKAAKQDYPPGENAAGYGYLAGIGASVDYAQALTWFEKASAAGNYVADANLGDTYAHGLGVPQDAAASLSWYQQAAQRGNRRAQLYLAHSYHDGSNGMQKDMGESQKYFDMVTETPVHTIGELRDAVYLIVDGHKRYPKEAVDKHETGTVLVTFWMAKRRVVAYHIDRSSGYPLLDAAARDDLADCYFPPIDPSIDSDRSYTIGIRFDLPTKQPLPAAATQAAVPAASIHE